MSTEVPQAGTQALAVIDRSRAIQKIDSPEQYEAAMQFRKDVLRAAMKAVADTFDPIVQKAHQAHKEAVAQKKKFYDPLEQEDARLNRECGAFVARQREAAEAEQRRLQAEARKREEDQRLAEAAALEAAGHKEEAAAVLDAEPVHVSAPVVVAAVPKMAGVGARDNWKFEIVDKAKIDPRWMMPDEKNIGATVRQFKKDAEQIVGGIRVWNEVGTTLR